MPINPNDVKWDAIDQSQVKWIDPSQVQWDSAFDPTEGMSGGEKFAAGAGKAVADIGRGTEQAFVNAPKLPGPSGGVHALSKLYQYATGRTPEVVQKGIDESRRLDAPLMNTGAGFAGNVTGNVAAAIPAAFIPGANTYAGASLIGAGMGALQPTVEGESRLNNTAYGALAGAGGQLAGKAIGKAASSAANKVASIERSVAEKAAAQAAADTASARSAAGNAAQNAYRQLEHLRELNAKGLLTPEGAQVAAQLEKELGEKAAEKLLPAAALKESTAKAFKEATDTEGVRASQLAADKLGGKEVKNQVMARVKRYGPAVAGGVVGNMIFPGLGGAVGGAATGLTLRPAIRSMFNLAKNPAVQHSLLSPVANVGPTDPKTQALINALLRTGALASVNTSE